MKKDIQVPRVGESVTGGILSTWLKNSGDTVQEGDEIFELETDKATMAVPSPFSGVLETLVESDTEVEIGQTVAVIDTEAAGRNQKQDKDRNESRTPAQSQDQTEDQPRDRDASAQLSPAVRRIAREHGLDPSRITGSGKGGRITKSDVLAGLDQGTGPDTGPDTGTANGIDTGAGPGTGAREKPTGPVESGPTEDRFTRKKISPLRRRIAENLVASKQAAAHLTTFNEIDMSRVIEIRSRYKERFEQSHGVKLGFMSFFVKAAVEALIAFPEVNAFFEGDEIRYNNYYNIAVAVSTEKGLLTPVIRDADTLSFAELETRIVSFGTRAAEKKLSPDELTGGTFTISNGGVFGSMLSTPIPSPPQTAILGMHAIQKRPVVIDDQIAIRPMMYLALTYDHRVIDGREAIGFLGRIKAAVEDPDRLLLQV